MSNVDAFKTEIEISSLSRSCAAYRDGAGLRPRQSLSLTMLLKGEV